MKTGPREQLRANGTLLESDPLISLDKKKRPQPLRGGRLLRWQGQMDGPPGWAVRRRRPGWESLWRSLGAQAPGSKAKIIGINATPS